LSIPQYALDFCGSAASWWHCERGSPYSFLHIEARPKNCRVDGYSTLDSDTDTGLRINNHEIAQDRALIQVTVYTLYNNKQVSPAETAAAPRSAAQRAAAPIPDRPIRLAQGFSALRRRLANPAAPWAHRRYTMPAVC